MPFTMLALNFQYYTFQDGRIQRGGSGDQSQLGVPCELHWGQVRLRQWGAGLRGRDQFGDMVTPRQSLPWRQQCTQLVSFVIFLYFFSLILNLKNKYFGEQKIY